MHLTVYADFRPSGHMRCGEPCPSQPNRTADPDHVATGDRGSNSAVVVSLRLLTADVSCRRRSSRAPSTIEMSGFPHCPSAIRPRPQAQSSPSRPVDARRTSRAGLPDRHLPVPAQPAAGDPSDFCNSDCETPPRELVVSLQTARSMVRAPGDSFLTACKGAKSAPGLSSTPSCRK